MALSKQEKLKLLHVDDPARGSVENPSAAFQDTRSVPSLLLSAPITDSWTSDLNRGTSSSNQPSYGEDIEPVIYSSNDENVSASKSKSASGKGRRNKKGEQRSFTSAAQLKTVASSGSTPGHPLQRGQLTSLEETFCPIQAVSKYPYRYVGKDLSASVAQGFFDAGKFWARTWDVYYIHPPTSIAVKPILLIPSNQVQALFTEVNEGLRCDLSFPETSEELGFVLSFNDDSTPRPRYLGQSTSRICFDTMASKVPKEDYKLAGEVQSTETPTDRSFAAFKQKMEAALEASKNKSKASRIKKQAERVHQKQGWCRELKRTQRYLGLRPRRTATAKEDPLHKPALSWTELQVAIQEHAVAAGQILPPLDITKPVPYAFDEDVVFICVDVESYERSHNVITEIGISTLDTRDLGAIPPEVDGRAWRDVIRSRHFRIREHAHLVNVDFVIGCADRFEFNNKQSEWISIKEAPQTVASCFRPPFSATFTPPTSNEAFPSIDAWNKMSSTQHQEEKRNIILVGQDTVTDINYLQKVGYNPLNLPNLLEILDTSTLYRALKRDNCTRSLGAILLDLGISGWNLHNAGNDAAYTLQAMIGIAFRGLSAKQDRERREVEKAKRVEDAVKEVEER
ncbi:MAG: hypothetical protein M1830_001392, partial [Pleopsidium flavum]